VVAVLEISRFYPSAVDQGLEAVVDLAQAHAQKLGEFTLRHVGVALEVAQDFKVDFLVGYQSLVFGRASENLQRRD
jgi:hydrogenase maturation factor